MIPEKISEIAIQSAECYWKYLLDKDRGWSSIEIFSIRPEPGEQGVFNLQLNSRIFDTEGILFRYLPDGKDYGPEDVKILEYDQKKNIIQVRPKTVLLDAFRRNETDAILVISDLKFLVKRVEDWFRENGNQIKLPEKESVLSGTLEEIKVFEHLPPSEDQMQAIRNVFTYPLSYVWGAPGTGKTQFVLAYSLLHYIRAGKRVAIFGPTNNAIEQVLRGILKMTDLAGVDRQKIFRMGVPSSSFANDYPDVCETQGARKRIKELEDEITSIKEVLKENRTREALVILQEAMPLLDESILLNPAPESFKRQKDGLYRKKTATLKAIAIFKAKVTSLKKKLKAEPENPKIKKNLSKAEMKLLQSENFLVQADAEISGLKMPERDPDKSWDLLNQFLTKVKTNPEIMAAIEEPESSEEMKQLLERWKQMCEDDLRKVKPGMAGMIELDEEYLNFRMQALTGELDLLKEKSADNRLAKSAVIAGTLDAFIGRFTSQKLDVSHFFLDEAGYANSIKALTLFREGIPVTILGDHLQLPPVCEMNDSEIQSNPENQNVFLWSQSALHIEDLFDLEPEECIKRYFSGAQPAFRKLVKSDLRATHRFGDDLAAVLDNFVYKNGFHSAYEDVFTDICVAHVPAENHSENRVNEREARFIAEMIPSLDTDDYVILTPYHLQRKRIGELIPDARRKMKILTVHGSQGREWDTVILSVVDTDRKWFTDSKNTRSRGLNVLNTAVSRAQRRLIIVCDGNHWWFQDGQFLQGLVRIARPLTGRRAGKE